MNFQTLVAGGENYLLGLIADGLTESLMVELKGNSDKEPLFREGRSTPHGRQVLGKSLGAFANSAGGLLILGVDCHSDRASGVSPIAQIDTALADVVGRIGELILPRHDGIAVEAIRSGNGAGYLAVYVERSERRPHMSFDHKYYKRAGSSSFVMEHYDVEDAFRRVAVPSLNLSWKLQPNTDMHLKPTLQLQFALKNDGAVTAKHVAITLEPVSGPQLHVQTMYTKFEIGRVASGVRIAAPSDMVINPGQSTGFHSAYLKLASPVEGGLMSVVGGPRADVDYRVTFSAENMAPTTQRIQLTHQDLKHLLDATLYRT